VLRDRSVLARLSEDGAIENVYRLQLMNATLQPRRLLVSASAEGAAVRPVAIERGHAIEVAPAATAMTVLTLRMAAPTAQQQQQPGGALRMIPIRFEVRDAAGGQPLKAWSTSTFALR